MAKCNQMTSLPFKGLNCDLQKDGTWCLAVTICNYLKSLTFGHSPSSSVLFDICTRMLQICAVTIVWRIRLKINRIVLWPVLCITVVCSPKHINVNSLRTVDLGLGSVCVLVNQGQFVFFSNQLFAYFSWYLVSPPSCRWTTSELW